MTSLDLSSLGLESVPPEVWELTQLTALDLSSNKLETTPFEGRLSTLPAEIGRLTRLTTLNVSFNGGMVLPPEIGELTQLTYLDLSHNGRLVLPAEIGKLTQLTTLYLTRNGLRALPAEIGKLTQLTTLYVNGNQLSALPESLGRLEQLTDLRLGGNPLVSPPPEIIAAGTASVVAFLAGVTRDPVQQWASKVLVVGQGRAGKTSLLRALRGEAFDPQEDSTHGLSVGTLAVPHPDPEHADVRMRLSTWDFGGQDIYHATHQFFLSERSLFLLVWDAQVGWEESRLHYWLDMIAARSPKAPVVLVATHLGPRPPDFPLSDLRLAYPSLMVKNLSVDSCTGEGLAELRTVVATVASQLPLMGTRWPRTWLEAADAVREHPENHVSVEQLRAIMSGRGVADPVHQDALATALHSLGDILYYPQEVGLEDLVVLRPQWVTSYISRVLDDQELDVRGYYGLFTQDHQRRIWADLDPEMRRHFVTMMERFDLSDRVPWCGVADQSVVVLGSAGALLGSSVG
ncbi:COR domain-containing protein [Streptacidiphilus sp. N1-10]|uniref:non-specific serine/threonine protein kinase n=1 Tax=Streptacidiphilus jeojiensis TaxID=3229225 RepID=A0ABV6XQG4_9ACTN